MEGAEGDSHIGRGQVSLTCYMKLVNSDSLADWVGSPFCGSPIQSGASGGKAPTSMAHRRHKEEEEDADVLKLGSGLWL